MGIAYSGKRHSGDGQTPPPTQWSILTKIDVFDSLVKDWTLDVVELLDPKNDHRVNYARLSIVISYFEMMGLYLEGATSDLIATVRRVDPNRDISKHSVVHCDKSENTFRKGIEAVAETAGWNKNHVDKAVKNLYSALRCGLYHGGVARHGIWVMQLSSGNPFRLETPDVIVDPSKLIDRIRKHFQVYVSELRKLLQRGEEGDRNDNKLTRFIRRFDIEVVDKLEEKYQREHSAS